MGWGSREAYDDHLQAIALQCQDFLDLARCSAVVRHLPPLLKRIHEDNGLHMSLRQ